MGDAREDYARKFLQGELAVYDGRFNELGSQLGNMDKSIKALLPRADYTSEFAKLDEKLISIEGKEPFDYHSDIADIKVKIAEIQSSMNTYDGNFNDLSEQINISNSNFSTISNELAGIRAKQVSNLKAIKNNAKQNTNKVIKAFPS